MKKIFAPLLALISIVIGAVVGYIRSDIFRTHYEGYTGVVLSSASLSLTLLTTFLVIFAVAVFVVCRKFFAGYRLPRKLNIFGMILVALGAVAILFSAYYAITLADGGFFEKTFAISAIVAVIYLAMSMVPVKGTMSDLLSCGAVLPAALVLLSIYKTNIKYPNISLFAFEVLAALFLMLGFYFISAGNFKRVSAAMAVWVTSLAVMFSLSSVVTHFMVMENYIFDPVASGFSIYYFIGASLVLLGFSSSPEAVNEEKLITMLDGYVLLSGNDSIDLDVNLNSNCFTSHAEQKGTIAEEGKRYLVDGFAVEGFLFDGEETKTLGHHITTPEGKTLLSLTHGTDKTLSDKLIKALGENHGKVDYVVVKEGESTAKMLERLGGKLKYGKVITLKPDEKIVL